MAGSFDEFLKEPRVLWMVVVLHREGPMTFRQFTQASGFWSGTAQQLREKMEQWGIIHVEGKGTWGATQHISLTRQGHALYEDVIAMGKHIDARERTKG